jgi:hypothetical protein
MEPDKERKGLRSQRMEALVRSPQFGKYKRGKLDEAKKEFGQSSSELERLRTGTHLLEKWVRDRLGSGDLNLGLNDLLKEGNEIWEAVFDLIADETVSAAEVFNAYRRMKSKRRRTMGGEWGRDTKGKKVFVCEPSEIPATEDSASAEYDEESKQPMTAMTEPGSEFTGRTETHRTRVSSFAVNSSQRGRTTTAQGTSKTRTPFQSTQVSLDSFITQKKPRSSRRGGRGRGK